MARPLRWTDLSLGLAGLAALLALAAAILLSGRAGGLRGPWFTLNVLAADAQGLLRGTEVWLSGRHVGSVSAVEFLPPEADPERRVLLRLQVVERVREHVRRDSHVEVRAGGRVLGAPVVHVSIGSARTRGVEDGDTLVVRPPFDVQAVRTELAAAARELPAIVANVRQIGARARGAEGGGTVSAFMQDDRRAFLEVRGAARTLQERLTTDRGTLGRLLDTRSDVDERARAVAARADSLLSVFGRGTPVTARRADSLRGELASPLPGLAAIQALARSPQGTFGRLRLDQAVFAGGDSARAGFEALARDARRRPARYIHF